MTTDRPNYGDRQAATTPFLTFSRIRDARDASAPETRSWGVDVASVRL